MQVCLLDKFTAQRTLPFDSVQQHFINEPNLGGNYSGRILCPLNTKIASQKEIMHRSQDIQNAQQSRSLAG